MTSQDDKELSVRRTANGEHRLPPAAAVVIAGATYALLPGSLLFAPRFVIPAVELALLVALVITNPRRMTRESKWSRVASLVLSSVVIMTNLVALGMLVHALTQKGTPGGPLLVAAMQVWLTTVVVRSPAGSRPTRRCHPPTGGSPRTRTTTPSPRWP
jgi:hypothetical protein